MTDPLQALATLIDRLSRSADLDDVLTNSLDALAGVFGFEHSLLMLLDETGGFLYTIASRGYERAGVGSEVRVGEGVAGQVAATGRPLRVNNLQRMLVYARRARGSADVTEIPLPGLPEANSQLAVPAMVRGQLVGVLVVESARLGAFTEQDELRLAVVAHLVAAAIRLDALESGAGADAAPAPSVEPTRSSGPGGTVRFYAAVGSTFIDDDYLIKGVPGRILWRLLRDYLQHGRTDFTNREVRLDPALELPAFRDNLESRLILLKRRLDERQAPMRIVKTGRGRFRLEVEGNLRIDEPNVDS
ncbi:MAG: ptsp [Actinomycetia bacterium]|nr:ptsp [Actinomycetes bacterium]